MKKIILIIVVLFCNAQIEAQYRWRLLPTKMLYPVSGGQVVFDSSAANTKFYLLGGRSDSLQNPVDWIQEYDVVKNTWRIVGRMVQTRENFVADIWKNIVFSFGGTTETSTDKNAVESWDYKIVTNLSSVYDRKKDFGRIYSTGHISGGNLYIIGGDPSNTGDTLAYIVAYSLDTKQVGFTFNFSSPNKDQPRYHMTFIVGDNIYIFGGVTNGVMNSIQRFNIPSKKLDNLSPGNILLEPRAGGAAVYNPISRRGFIIGGFNEKYTALNTVEEVSVQPDGTLQITKSAPLNIARTNPMVVNYRGTVAVFGGKDLNGNVVPEVETLESTTNVANENILPAEYRLFQNYPNPFNPETVISYQLPVSSYVTLKIYDILGREVATLVDEYKQAGTYSVDFNVEKSHSAGGGSSLPSGVYFYTLRAGDYFQTKKMVFLK